MGENYYILVIFSLGGGYYIAGFPGEGSYYGGKTALQHRPSTFFKDYIVLVFYSYLLIKANQNAFDLPLHIAYFFIDLEMSN